MAVLTKDKGPSSHWYHLDGTPQHRVPKADGSGDRSTTIKDARRLSLLPSVTSVTSSVLARPQLINWKLKNAVMATLRTPRQENESDEYWCKRVLEVAEEQTEDAADMGTLIHGALEAAMAGEPYNDELRAYVEPVLAWKNQTGIVIVEREKRVVNPLHGFAGTTDVLFRYGQNGIGILDYKTKNTKPGKRADAYDDQAMQLAAYAATYWGEENLGRVLAANIFISRTEAGRIDVIKHTDMPVHWEAFKMVAALWRYMNNFDPRVAQALEETK